MAVYTDNGTNTPNGSHLEFTYTFPTIKTDGTDVKVALNGQTQATNKYTVTTTSPTKITFNNTNVDSALQESTGAPKTGVTVRVYRDTYVDAAEAVYAAGSSIRAADLNNNQDQVLYALQEEQQLQINNEDIADGAVTTAKITDKNVTLDKIEDLTSSKIIVGNSSNRPAAVSASGDVTISNTGAVTIANDAVTGAKIDSDTITNDNIAPNTIQGNSIAENAVGAGEIAENSVGSSELKTNSVELVHMTNASVGTDELIDDKITNAKIKSDAAIAFSKMADLTASRALASDSNGDVSATTVTSTELGFVDGVTSAIQTQIDNKQDSDAELTELATMGSTTASALADLTQAEVQILDGAQVSTAELNKLVGYTGSADDLNELNGLDKETTITDNDNKFPTSKAVVNYVAAQLEPFGGFEIIANRTSFPNTQPASGVAISITDANGIVFDSTSTPDSTTGNCKTAGNTNVTIQAAPDALQGKTIGAGVGMLVSSTGSSQNYTFHRLLAKDDDVEQLSQDINDFKNRYRVASSEGALTGTDDEGDLYFDTGANKMYVYDGSSWGEVTSTGDFKYLVLSQQGNNNAPSYGSVDTFDLHENTLSGSLASVTSAAQLMVSVNGVIQKPNSGTSTSGLDGFVMTDGHTIKFTENPPANSVIFVIQSGSALSINTPGASTVTEASLNLSGGSNGEFLKKDSTAGGGFVWGAVPAGVGGATGLDLNDDVKIRFGTDNDAFLGFDITGHTANVLMMCQPDGEIHIRADEFMLLSDDTNGRAIYLDNGNDQLELGFDGQADLYLSGTSARFISDVQIDAQKDLRFADADSSNYVAVQAPATVGSNYTVTLPAAAPTANGQALVATTAGVASWDTVSSTTLDGCGYQNDQTISAGTYEIAANKGVHSVGPITVEGTVTVTGNWVVS